VPAFLSLLLLPALLVAGWQIARRCDIGSHVQRTLAAVALSWMFVVMLAGLMRDTREWILELHRWGAHGFLILIYLATPLAIGARFGQRAGSAGFVILLLSLLLVSFLASITGYLNPTPEELAANAVHAETHNRFVVLHMIVLPLVTLVLTGLWVRAAWRPSAAT
jgi:hypothetical protein